MDQVTKRCNLAQKLVKNPSQRGATGGSAGRCTPGKLESANEERRRHSICSTLKIPSFSEGPSCTRLLSAGEEFALAPSASY